MLCIIVDGVCEGIDAGLVTVKLLGGRCKLYSNIGSCWFGWHNSIHLMISEVFVDRQIINFG